MKGRKASGKGEHERGDLEQVEEATHKTFLISPPPHPSLSISLTCSCWPSGKM